MEDSPATTMADGSLSLAIDSNEVRMKQRSVSHPQSNLRYVQTPQSGVQVTTIATPQAYSDLCPDVRDTPLGAETTPKPSFTQSNVYPQRSKSDLHTTSSSSHHPVQGTLNPNQVSGNTYSVPTKITPFTPLDIYWSEIL